LIQDDLLKELERIIYPIDYLLDSGGPPEGAGKDLPPASQPAD